MVEVNLNWYQRISVWLRVGSIQAPNMRVASALYGVIKKIRPDEKERDETKLSTHANGRYEWFLPHPDYGSITVELESEEAEQLAHALENPTQEMSVLVLDMEWLLPLIDRLKTRQGELVQAA